MVIESNGHRVTSTPNEGAEDVPLERNWPSEDRQCKHMRSQVCNTSSMKLWNVCAALRRPNGNLRNSKSPKGHDYSHLGNTIWCNGYLMVCPEEVNVSETYSSL